MELLTGEFRITLDDKGRLSLPSRLRGALAETTLYLTQGIVDSCLMLYAPAEWSALVNTIMETTNPFSSSDRNIRRRIIGPAQEVEIDKAGRIPVAQSLREFAGLAKDCVVIGQVEYIEIWSEDKYREYLKESEAEFESGSRELGSRLKGNKDCNK